MPVRSVVWTTPRSHTLRRRRSQPLRLRLGSLPTDAPSLSVVPEQPLYPCVVRTQKEKFVTLSRFIYPKIKPSTLYIYGCVRINIPLST